MQLSPDNQIFWQYGCVKINATIVFTWLLMAILVVGARILTARLSTGVRRSRWQHVLETVVLTMEKQIAEVGLTDPRSFIGFIGTIFLFVALASLGTIVPGYRPPTGSLSTTAALALCVFVAAPVYGIQTNGLFGYLRTYMEPSVLMLPFNVIGEISRTLALAVRLFGNMMSGEMIVGILLTITPYFFPIVMTLFGLLTGMVQAYIFSVLATVYIAAATSDRSPRPKPAVQP